MNTPEIPYPTPPGIAGIPYPDRTPPDRPRPGMNSPKIQYPTPPGTAGIPYPNRKQQISQDRQANGTRRAFHVFVQHRRAIE